MFSWDVQDPWQDSWSRYGAPARLRSLDGEDGVAADGGRRESRYPVNAATRPASPAAAKPPAGTDRSIAPPTIGDPSAGFALGSPIVGGAIGDPSAGFALGSPIVGGAIDLSVPAGVV